MTNYQLESFINFCDDMQIAEEGLFKKKEDKITVSKEDVNNCIKIIKEKVAQYAKELNSDSSFQSKMKKEIKENFDKYGDGDKDVWEEEYNRGQVPKFNPHGELETYNGALQLVFNMFGTGDGYSQDMNIIMGEGTNIIINKLKSDSSINHKVIQKYGFGDGDEGILEIKFHPCK